jgi:hypothetical protein
MARIQPEDAQAWAEETKLPVAQFESFLVAQVETQVLAKLSAAFPAEVTSTWVDPATTPPMVKTVISMLYVAWYYEKHYSEEQTNLNDYATLLRAHAETLIVGMLDGSIVVPEAPIPVQGDPAFYPNDTSSAQLPTSMDRSLGDAKFSMGEVY